MNCSPSSLKISLGKSCLAKNSMWQTAICLAVKSEMGKQSVQSEALQMDVRMWHFMPVPGRNGPMMSSEMHSKGIVGEWM